MAMPIETTGLIPCSVSHNGVVEFFPTLYHKYPQGDWHARGRVLGIPSSAGAASSAYTYRDGHQIIVGLYGDGHRIGEFPLTDLCYP